VLLTFLERWNKSPDEVRRQSMTDIFIVMKRLEWEKEEADKKRKEVEDKNKRAADTSDSRRRMDTLMKQMR